MGKTHRVGDAAEAAILAALLRLGKWVSIPFGYSQPYDLIVDDNGRLLRVQCKTAWLVNGGGSIAIPLSKLGKRYRDSVDIVAGYSFVTGKVYWINVKDRSLGRYSIQLRIKLTRNGQKKKVRTASDYELEKVFRVGG